MEKVHFTIIGGGVIGCAIAYELSKYFDDIFLFEKEPRLGTAQSERNSGVIHAGVYYNKNSLKAKLCIEGNPMLYNFCNKYDIPVVNTKKLIIATDKKEKKALDFYLKRALDNGVLGIKKISKKELKKMQPTVSGLSALYVPSTGLIDSSSYLKTLVRLAKNNKVEVLKEAEVINIEPKIDSFELRIKRRTSEEIFETKILINAAGLYSDKIAKMVNQDIPYIITPIRGEYCKFNQKNKPELNIKQMCIYPTPMTHTIDGKKAKTLGVHLTPTFELLKDNKYNVGSIVLVGPTAVSVDDKEDYKKNRQPIKYFYEKIRSYFPNIKLEQLNMDFSGIRAKLKDCEDFVIERDNKYPNCINLVGIDSPGLTASLAIAKYVKGLLK